MTINSAVACLARKYNTTRHSVVECQGMEYKHVFLLGEDDVHVDLFGIDGQLVSISLTCGFYYRTYTVADRKQLLAAVADYEAVGALMRNAS